MILTLQKDDHRIPQVVDAVSAIFPFVAAELVDLVRRANNGIFISLERLKADQTDSQRNYYHKWKNEFADHLGLYPDELHEILLCEVYGSEIIESPLGLVQRPLNRSSGADRNEYAELIDGMIRIAAEQGFVIPPPKTQTDLNWSNV